MLSLLLLVVFGLGIAFFATQNVAGSTITIANSTYQGIPMYAIVIGSLLLGIFVSWLISMVDAISSLFTIHGKDTALNEANETIKKLKLTNRELELENANLKGEKNTPIIVEKTHEPARPSFLSRLKNTYSV